MIQNDNEVYYTVNNKKIFHKIDAILEANNNELDVKWHFYEETFKSLNWYEEPEQSLDYYYKLRALQIRLKYDYVVLFCSGGADSTNVLKSFINNDIHIDEVIFSAPISGLSNFNFNTSDSSHSNTMSETKFAQFPLMQELHNLNSKIKITINDYFNNIINYESEKWIYDSEDWIHPSGLSRYQLEHIKHLKDLAEQGKKIALVYGIDKPVLFLSGRDDEELYTVFSDLAVNVQRPAFSTNYPNVDNVLFYWSKNLPEMLIKQAHTVANWIFDQKNQDSLIYFKSSRKLANHTYAENRFHHSRYERSIVPCIYPSTYRKVFQAEKPVKNFLGEHDYWFYQLHQKTTHYDMMVGETVTFFKKIKRKYLNPGNYGFLNYHNMYKIGNLSDFTKDVSRVKSILSTPTNLIPHISFNYEFR